MFNANLTIPSHLLFVVFRRNFREIQGYANIQEQKILFITIVPDIAGSQNENFRRAMEMRIALIQ